MHIQVRDESSIFISEINPEEKPQKKEKVKRKKENVLLKPTPLLKKKPAVTSQASVPENLIIGARISSPKYGEGTITDVVWDDDEIPMKFTVEFDSGNERIFMYPFAFTTGMKVIE